MLIGIFSIVTLIAVLNESWGAAVVSGLIVLALLFMLSENKKDMQAYWNMRDYWAKGGSNGRKR